MWAVVVDSEVYANQVLPQVLNAVSHLLSIVKPAADQQQQNNNTPRTILRATASSTTPTPATSPTNSETSSVKVVSAAAVVQTPLCFPTGSVSETARVSASGSGVNGPGNKQQMAMRTKEQLARQVYHLCCCRYGQQLLNDVITFVRTQLQQAVNSLVATTALPLYLDAILQLHTHYEQSALVLVSVFRDVDRVQPSPTLPGILYAQQSNRFSPKGASTHQPYTYSHHAHHTTFLYTQSDSTPSSVAIELQRAFLETVLHDHRVGAQVDILLRNPPLHAPPETMLKVVKLLYSMDKDFAEINKNLFALYIPCLLARTSDPEACVQEARQLLHQAEQQQLQRQQMQQWVQNDGSNNTTTASSTTSSEEANRGHKRKLLSP
ncbi:hypothetical protein Pelo_5223 [Pelomyxa schiedti]|nr:hypothetical protein Pelo_5223 [Pelomyxa schiedti]